MASFKKLKTGWQYRISFKENGVYKTKSGNGFGSKRAAQVAANAEETKLFNGVSLNAGEIDFPTFYENWARLYKIGLYSKVNDAAYETSIKLVQQYFTGIKIKEITKASYQHFINDFAKTHSKATVKKRNGHIRSCFADAIDEKIIQVDPTRNVTVTGAIKPKKKESKYLNYSQFKKLIEETKKDLNPLYVGRYMILLGSSSGCRFSEICALTWDDIDYSNRTILINKSWDYKNSNDFTDTKTFESERTIRIDKDILDILKAYQKDQKRTLEKFGVTNEKNLVFLNYENSIISNNAVNKTLEKLCLRVTDQAITFHGLRHTHASVLLFKGINIVSLSKRLGHSDITTTSNTYSHVLKELEELDNNKTDKIMQDLYK
ncbi:tyrosine-type recombinase/integrase [Carnobacterium maltaromaticum]|uniref:tyrosine-type recombinase/integrase n=1 Tax=Carnobacterium maltaromaticum TaxID=2751 RepID=UPI0039B06B56